MEEDGHVQCYYFDLRHQDDTVRASHLFAYYVRCRTDAFYCCKKPYLEYTDKLTARRQFDDSLIPAKLIPAKPELT